MNFAVIFLKLIIKNIFSFVATNTSSLHEGTYSSSLVVVINRSHQVMIQMSH